MRLSSFQWNKSCERGAGLLINGKTTRCLDVIKIVKNYVDGGFL